MRYTSFRIIILAILAVACSGCGDLWEPGRRRIKRRTHDLQLRLGNEQYDKAQEMCTKNAVWQRLDGKKAPIRYFFADLKKVKQKRSFYIIIKNHNEVTEKKIAYICDMRQQIQVGLIDVGNHMWESQITWVQTGPREWKISRIKDLKKWDYKRSE